MFGPFTELALTSSTADTHPLLVFVTSAVKRHMQLPSASFWICGVPLLAVAAQ